MKKKFLAILVPTLSLLLASCSKDQRDTFDIPHGEEAHTHAVDLGLSVKWACCNVGAEYPEEYGGYYAWGDPEEKDSCIWDRYKWHDSITEEITKYNDLDKIKVLELSDDVAHIMWGDGWRMPTQEEMQELMDCCEWEWVSVNGVKGYRVSGNGNSIFLPAAGSQYKDNFTSQGSQGCYMSATLYSADCGLDVCMGFSKKGYYIINSDRCDGHTIRPVRK
jgi:uncharacterized protein (TIGR02145 family)